MDICTACGALLDDAAAQVCGRCGQPRRPAVGVQGWETQTSGTPYFGTPDQGMDAQWPAVPPVAHQPTWSTVGPRSGGDGKRMQTAMISLAVVGVVGAGLTAWLTLKPPSADAVNLVNRSTSSATAPQSATPTPPPSPTSAAPTPDTAAEQQELGAFVPVLASSVSARNEVVTEVSRLGACQGDPAVGIADLDDAANSRHASASAITQWDVHAIPNGTVLKTDLVALLNSSATADEGYAQWMEDIQTGGCWVVAAADPGYQAGNTASQGATANKQAFLGLWNPLAAQFGLPTYTQDEL